MKTSTEQLQQDMDKILVKTLVTLQPILEEQGEEAALEFIDNIASGIKQELLEREGSIDPSSKYALDIHKIFLHDLKAALFSTKH